MVKVKVAAYCNRGIRISEPKTKNKTLWYQTLRIHIVIRWKYGIIWLIESIQFAKEAVAME